MQGFEFNPDRNDSQNKKLSGERYSRILIEWVHDELACKTNGFAVSLDQIANVIGVSRPMISQVRQNKKTFGSKIFKQLAASYGMTLGHFLSRLAEFERENQTTAENPQSFFSWHSRGLPDTKRWLSVIMGRAREILMGPRLTKDDQTGRPKTAVEKALQELFRSLSSMLQDISQSTTCIAIVVFEFKHGAVTKQVSLSGLLKTATSSDRGENVVTSQDMLSPTLLGLIDSCWGNATFSPISYSVRGDREDFWKNIGTQKIAEANLPGTVLACPISRRKLLYPSSVSRDVRATFIVGFDVDFDLPSDARISSEMACVVARDDEKRNACLVELMTQASLAGDYICAGVLSDMAAASVAEQFDFNHSMQAVLHAQPSIHSERLEFFVKKVLDRLQKNVAPASTSTFGKLLAVDAWFIEVGEGGFHSPNGFDLMTFVSALGETCMVHDPESGQDVRFNEYYKHNLDALCPRIPHGKSFAAIEGWSEIWVDGNSISELTPRAMAMNLGDSVGIPFVFSSKEWRQRGIFWMRFFGEVENRDLVMEELAAMFAPNRLKNFSDSNVSFEICVPGACNVGAKESKSKKRHKGKR